MDDLYSKSRDIPDTTQIVKRFTPLIEKKISPFLHFLLSKLKLLNLCKEYFLGKFLNNFPMYIW